MSDIQTPAFVIREDKLQRQVNDLKTALSKNFLKSIAGYSFKTNNLPWLISYMKENGLWAEVVSSDEYNLAKRLGYPIEKIIFNGPAKGRSEFVEAVENGAIVNIDSKRELRWLLGCDPKTRNCWRIGLRVNFCLEEKCPGETQGGNDDGRFGFSVESGELSDAISFLKVNDIPLSGLHLHCSSKTRSLNIYKAIAETAVDIVKSYGLNIGYVDIGGGFFGGVAGKPIFDDYFALVGSILAKAIDLNKTTVMVEPGISLVGSTIDYIATVVDVKSTKNNRFVLLDGSRIHVDPLMRKASYSYHIEHYTIQERESQPQILCGFTCMENDRFFRYEGASLLEGDKIVFEKVGAYTMGLSPQFIEAYPAVYAERGEEIELVRKKQNLPNT